MTRLFGSGKKLWRRMILSVTMLLEEKGEWEGGGEKWVGWSVKALVGFGLWSGGDAHPPQTLTDVMPMMQ